MNMATNNIVVRKQVNSHKRVCSLNHSLTLNQVELHYQNKEPKSQVITNTMPASPRQIKKYDYHDGLEYFNKLIYGDNLSILKYFYQDTEIKGKVRLVYIDPPFSTGRIFDQEDDMTRYGERVYEDTLLGHEYLEFLRKRLIFLREILADDGSIYVHLDQKIAHYVKVLMDEIFGIRNFRNWITRQKCHPKGYTKKSYGNIQDFILFYTKSDRYIWNKPLGELTEEKIVSSEYIYIEEKTKRIYKKVPLHAPGVRYGRTGLPWRGRLPPKGKHWQYPPEKLEEFDRDGKIYWSPTGNPRLKIYLDERNGVLVQDIWPDFLDPMNQFTFLTGYPTEKNQAMLELIVNTSSNEGDIVLDCFAGSGTTLVAAEKLKRKWIGVDNSKAAIDTVIKRLLNTAGKDNLKLQPFCLYEAVP